MIEGKALNKLKISSQIEKLPLPFKKFHINKKKEQHRFEQEQKELMFISADILKD